MTHLIHIQWEGPHRIGDLLALHDPSRDYGLYQIYAHHPVYGAGSLVYIGQAIDRTFGKRIAEHRWGTGSEPDPTNVLVYVGRLKYDSSASEAQWRQDVYLAEKLLIHWHAPAYNSTHIMSIYNEHEVHDVRVINFGAVRSLAHEVSGYLGSAGAKQVFTADPYSRPLT